MVHKEDSNSSRKGTVMEVSQQAPACLMLALPGACADAYTAMQKCNYATATFQSQASMTRSIMQLIVSVRSVPPGCDVLVTCTA